MSKPNASPSSANSSLKKSNSSSSGSSGGNSVTKGVAQLNVSGIRTSNSSNSKEGNSPSPGSAGSSSHKKTGSLGGMDRLTLTPTLKPTSEPANNNTNNARRRLSVMGDNDNDKSRIDGSSDMKTTANNNNSATGNSTADKNKASANATRRRLSVMGGADNQNDQLDGVTDVTGESRQSNVKVLRARADSITEKPGSVAAKAISSAAATSPVAPKKRLFSHYATLSKVGYVPFNPSKVNQDRTVEVVKFGGSEDKAFFGVFDGHVSKISNQLYNLY